MILLIILVGASNFDWSEFAKGLRIKNIYVCLCVTKLKLKLVMCRKSRELMLYYGGHQLDCTLYYVHSSCLSWVLDHFSGSLLTISRSHLRYGNDPVYYLVIVNTQISGLEHKEMNLILVEKVN